MRLSRVLTPGKDSRNDYVSYRHNFATISKKMRKGCPALQAGRLGAYWTASIAGKKVVIFKSDSHLSQDVKRAPTPGQTLPNEDVWRQIIAEVNPTLVITTGTAGGIGTQCEVGDVVVSRIVRFDCQNWLKKEPFAAAIYSDGAAKTKYFAKAKVLFKANSGQLPPDNTRPPKIVIATKDAQARADDGLLRVRYVGRSLEAAGIGSGLRNGRCGAGADQGRYAEPALGGGAQRLRSADQGRGHTQGPGQSRGADLQGIRPLEFGLQRDRLLGTDRRVRTDIHIVHLVIGHETGGTSSRTAMPSSAFDGAG